MSFVLFRDKDRERRERDPDFEEKVRIKVEPPDDYPEYPENSYDNGDYENPAVKYEKDEDERNKYREEMKADRSLEENGDEPYTEERY